MKNIELYLGDKKVEFSTQPDILYTYAIDNIQNPTAVKNSFTKTINIDGTPINDQIFGEFWNLERQQGTGGVSGADFNSSKKVDFQLFMNGDLVETGYLKLNNVYSNGSTRYYEVTLYGGLGDFFYNLSTNDADGEKLKLSDLEYGEDLDYTINIDTVKDAWDNLGKDTGKWSVINFAPAYNGIKDFDSKHVVINTKNTTFEKSIKADNGKIFTTKDGFVLGNLITDLTEHEIRDYRSYLNRPVIRMKKIIEACCDEEQNGGYKVNLDPEFFNDNNPYWNDTWLTLPMISNLELSNDQQVLEDTVLTPQQTTGENNSYMYSDLVLELGSYPESLSNLSVTANIETHSMFHYSSIVNTDWFGTHLWLGSLFVQLLAYNGDNVVGASQSYNLTTLGQEDNKKKYGTNDDYKDYSDGHYTPHPLNTKIVDAVGIFDWNGFIRDNFIGAYNFKFDINNINAPVTGLKFRFFWGSNKKKHSKHKEKNWLFEYKGGWNPQGGTIDRQFIIPVIKETDFSAVAGESLGRTGTRIDKYSLLNTANSPAEYLLSYAKMFGLYFYKNPTEKEISILTRNNYYDKSDIIDLTNFIDTGSSIKITPTVFDTRWITFSPKQDNTEFFTKYSLTEGVNYGDKLVNTGYDFDSDKRNTLDNNVIKSAIEGHEKSKYFSQYSGDSSVRPWMIGMTYNLYNDTDTMERTPEVIGGTLFGINESDGLKFYDLFPKLQFHSDNNKPTDGNDVLVFYSGKINVNQNRANNVNYILSDDTRYQTFLNDGSPCWLFTNTEMDNHNNRLCYKLNEIPVFERYLTQSGSNMIQQSLDFGAPRQLYCQLYEYKEARTIYDGYWAEYLSDLYDVNTKVLECMVNTNGQKPYDWLRKFFWYENSLWRVNKITDYNIASPSLTKIEFVKVQDLNNYSNKTIEKPKSLSLTLSKYNVSPQGETINATVTTEAGNAWTITYTDGLTLSRTSGTGTMTFTITVPAKRDDSVGRYTIIARTNDNQVSATITQNAEGFITVTENGSYVGRDIPMDGGELQLNVKSVYPWTLSTDDDRIQFSIKYGNGDSVNGENITVIFPESSAIVPYDVVVTFTEEYGKVAYWNKRQLPLNGWNYPKEGGSKKVYAGSAGLIFSTPEWITVTDDGNGYYTFTASKNSNDEPRKNAIVSGSISATVSQDAGDRPKTIFEVSPNVLEFNEVGGSQSMFLNNSDNADWSVFAFPDWIESINPQSGSTSTIINVTVGNNDGPSKTGNIIIANNETNESLYIQVSVKGTEVIEECISLSEDTVYIDPKGGSVQITVDACGDWTSEYDN